MTFGMSRHTRLVVASQNMKQYMYRETIFKRPRPVAQTLTNPRLPPVGADTADAAQTSASLQLPRR